MGEQQRQRATGRTQVESYVPSAFDQVGDGPTLVEVRLTERFTGDVEGEGTGRAIQAVRPNRSATFVAIERVRGAIAGRAGSFVLRVSGSVSGDAMTAEWSVVPGSGTAALAGLRGDGGFEARLGQHGTIWLDYWFE